MKRKIIPAVIFQQPETLALVDGEATDRLALWEQSLASVIGGRRCLEGEKPTTRCQSGCKVINDDCKDD